MFFILYILHLVHTIYPNMNIASMSSLNIVAWNVNCNTEIAGKYLNQLANEAEFIALSEHGLFPSELYKLDNIIPGFKSCAKSSAQLNDKDFGYKRRMGGCAILWNENKFKYKVKPTPALGSDRIVVVELHIQNRIHFIISVYMPHQTCSIADYVTELRLLQDVLDECMPRGPCYLAGDFNVHFGEEYRLYYEERVWGTSNRNTSKLHKFVTTNNMTIVDLCDFTSGERYTFSGGHGMSYLDHFVTSNDVYNNIVACCIFSDSVFNPSDHLPLRMSVRLDISYDGSNTQTSRRVAWNKMDSACISTSYTLPLEDRVCEVLNSYGVNPINVQHQCEFPCSDQIALENIIDSLGDSIKEVTQTLPSNVYNKALKPYWNKDLTALSKSKRNSRSVWVSAGKPRNMDSRALQSYKQSKREFRKQQRRRIYEMQNRNMTEFSESQELDSKYFWYVVNKHKKHRSCTPIKSDNGDILTDVNDIRNEWTHYYSELYSESENEQYDDDFKSKVEHEVKQFGRSTICQEHLEGGPISTDEILKIVSKLKNNKASGWDFIMSEHLKNAGPIFASTLTWILNSCVHNSYIPKYFKKGLLVPIPKPHKDVLIKDNNRGITLMPVFYKLFEKIMIEREKTWLQNNAVIDAIQSAGKEKLSCLHTSFVVQETIAYSLNRGSSVYAAFLDARKAFDTVWIDGMLHKLLMSGINIKLWQLIKSGYTDFECAVFIGGETGDWFQPKRGVHQGAPLSMYLYLIYVNDMIVKLRQCGHGITIGRTIITSPAHADDITLMALYKSSLNILLHIAYQYSIKWRYMFNTVKTELMVWGRDTQPNIEAKFGGDILKPVEVCKHMGIKLYTKGKQVKGIYEDRIGAAKRVMFAAKGLGSQIIPVPPPILSKIYWTVAIPKLLYGLDVCPIEQSPIIMLEDAHRQFSKFVQYLPQNTPTPASCATIGWVTIEPYIAIMKIMFILRTLCLPSTNIFREILTNRLTDLLHSDNYHREGFVGPVGSALKYFYKYGLMELLRQFICNGSNDMLKRAKSNVKNVIISLETDRWKASCMMYSELSIYMKCVRSINVHVWWSLAKTRPNLIYKIAAILAVCMGNQPKGLQCNFNRKLCYLCDQRQLDSPKHILFECDAFAIYRFSKLKQIIECMPEGMRYSFRNISLDEKVILLLSGLHCEVYIKEWSNLMIEICEYVYEIYRQRKTKYDGITLNGVT